jgi:hypothetical protein
MRENVFDEGSSRATHASCLTRIVHREANLKPILAVSLEGRHDKVTAIDHSTPGLLMLSSSLRTSLLAILVIPLAVIPAPSAPPEAPPPRPVTPPAIDPALADWTPRPATGKAEPWEKATDKDWIDPRFQSMNTGPFLDCTMRYPLEKNQAMVYKATVVKLGEKGDAGAVFDRCTMRLAAAWTGGYLNISDRRFGLLNTPTPKGEILFATSPSPGWANQAGTGVTKVNRFTIPLPEEWVKYRGLYISGKRTVLKYTVGKIEILDSPTLETVDGFPCVMRTIRVPPTDKPETVAVGRLPSWVRSEYRTRDIQMIDDDRPDSGFIIFAVKGDQREAHFHHIGGGEVCITFPPSQATRVIRVFAANHADIDHPKFRKALQDLPAAEDPIKLTKGGPKRWGEPIVTKLIRGEDSGPFAIDTLTIPYQNAFGSLFFCTGLDFLPDGRIAMCTCHGDVWLVKVDEKAGTCSWQRFATGLYQPLGLKVIEGKVVVLERGQLTRLHDLNNDGEADFYECVSNDWHTGGGEHSYDTCLETDPQGNFYFFKTGDTDTPSGGCLLRVPRDGGKAEVFSTGFRHPIGLGMSPTGILTGADQEGNWMPATRIDEYKKGGFYGDMRAHHRAVAPKIYDQPICWLPREVDNSAGGQVWVPEKAFGPLAGLPLHFSYGRCKLFVLLRQETRDGTIQGGATDLGLKFLAGVCRGRFHPERPELYVCGLNGWQTAAQADGCLQRVRMTGKPLDVPVKLAIEGNTVRLTFSNPLDPKSAANIENYRCAWWNYIWTGEYGSKRWKVSNPKEEGQDEFGPKAVKLLDDRKTVELSFQSLQPVMQMQVGYNVATTEGRKVVGSTFLTINTTDK